MSPRVRERLETKTKPFASEAIPDLFTCRHVIVVYTYVQLTGSTVVFRYKRGSSWSSYQRRVRLGDPGCKDPVDGNHITTSKVPCLKYSK